LKIHIKNQTGYKIGLCQELTLAPEGAAIVEVQDEDFIYIDQIAQPNGEEDEDWTEELNHDD
jgi:hypothetical protein